MPDHRCWIAACALGAALAQAGPPDDIMPGNFSALQPGSALPQGWTRTAVADGRAPTSYSLVEDRGVTVLRAESSRSAAGLTHRLQVDPQEYPILKWRWKISNVITNADLSRKEGDDFPARLYVSFDYPIERLPLAERVKLRVARALYDPNLPAATLCYVWDGKAPTGTIAASAYSSRVRIMVVESGSARVNQWVNIARDLAGDFRAAFGEDAPAVSAIAVAVDTDNTGASVTTHFGDISLHKRTVKP